MSIHIEKITDRPCILPVFIKRVAAGFPSPADDYIDNELDLQDYLVRHPASTFLHIIEGESMEGAGIMSGDIVVVDRSLEPRAGDIIIAILNGEKTIKRLVKGQGGGYALVSEPREDNRATFPVFEIDEAHPFEVWGTVSGIVRRYK